ALPLARVPHTLANLEEGERHRLWTRVAESDPALGAALLGHFVDDHAAEILRGLDDKDAARLLDHVDSDNQVDVLARLPEEQSEAVLAEMAPAEARDARERLEHAPDTAGGVMITEFLCYPAETRRDTVLDDLRAHWDRFQRYEIRFVYALDGEGRLAGVVRLGRVVVAPPDVPLVALAMAGFPSVTVDTTLAALQDLFDRIVYSVVPVVDAAGRLVGLVRRSEVEEATAEDEARRFMKFGGIVGGEEVRAMPLARRTLRRLAFLLPNIALSYAAVSIIAAYEPLIEELAELAVFLPMVANLSGAAGNQAVAVSIRELSLGVVRPGDVLRVWRAEALLGLVNGVVIGAALWLVVAGTR
ncbi:MAG TPA: magnesium transporter, partial [Planctomycetota bacterium]|nr:magnesium transporter [Planctomycetota bacterium]